jgi:hypothetical protein
VKAPKVEVFAVVRWEGYGPTPELSFHVKEVVPTQQEAEAEVARLNASVDEADVRYFWNTTRFYPDGRGLPYGTGE